ncbi:MAG TPA: hypothetical protein VKB78_16050, partial [Pirellulales bacterium]|nr:hypothetical protein [Pirellulales bacterium]
MNSIPLMEAADEQDLSLIEPPLTFDSSAGAEDFDSFVSTIDIAADDATSIGESRPKAVAGLRTDSLAASVAILVALSIAQRLIGFARQILVCRWLEPDQLGEWDICFKFLMLGAP